jgi:hypothetical protein
MAIADLPDCIQRYQLEQLCFHVYNNRDVVYFGYDTVLTEIKRENGSTKPKLNKTGNKLTILNELQYADLVSNGFVQSYQYSESDASWNYLEIK